jgi:glucokinase
MALLGIDLGATKAAFAVFSNTGTLVSKDVVLLGQRGGNEAGRLITEHVASVLALPGNGNKIEAIGICVPGISHKNSGTVWAPNIQGWDDYPLLQEVRSVSGDIPVIIDSDRACYILGEFWQGNARGCRDAVFLSIGTGIGAGIMVNGEILRGKSDIGGAIGWMALSTPYCDKYDSCGCFEYNASGEGLSKVATDYLNEHKDYNGELKNKPDGKITSFDVFSAFKKNDPAAVSIITQSIIYWGMATANIVSLFNPEKIIIGGGLFGPAKDLIPEIKAEALKWAQPISIKQVLIEASSLSGDAGVYGAGYLALQILNKIKTGIR